MNQDAKQRVKKKMRSRAKDNGKEEDYSLISFSFTFSPNFPPKNPIKDLDLTFRFQTFKELREWGQIISPNSEMHPGDRFEAVLQSFINCLLSPKAKIFEEWFNELFEPDFENFLREYSKAKEEWQKK